jgi:hypothetical protein
MPTSKEFRQSSEDCLRLASETSEFFPKMALLEMAAEFRMKADGHNPPSTRNRCHRSGTVVVGSAGATTNAASKRSPIDHTRSERPKATAGVVRRTS